MKRRTVTLLGLALICLFLTPQCALAKEYGIVISGGDKNSDVEGWRQATADEFAGLLEGRGIPAANISRPNTKSGVKQAIDNVKPKLECGDNLVIYFNGHGTSSGKLCITPPGGGKTEYLSYRELLQWLQNPPLPCCCDIHLVIHCCYSGTFVEKVIVAEQHIQTAVSSSDSYRRAHKDVRRQPSSGAITFHGRDWPTGFNEDLKKVPPNTGWQETLQEAQKSAKAKMKGKWKKDKPRTWKRFEGHVIAIEYPKEGGPKKVKIKDKDGNVHEVIMRPGSTIKVGDQEIPYCAVKVCSDIKVVVTEDDKGEYIVRHASGSINIADASGHIEGVDRSKGTITIHFDEPKALRCKTREVRMKPGTAIPEWMQECKWIKVTEGHMDSSIVIGGATEEDPPELKIVGHVSSVDREAGEITIHIHKPKWLRCRTKKVKLKPGARVPGWAEECKWVEVKGTLEDGHIEGTGVVQIPPQRLSYRVHVREVDQQAGTAIVHISEPSWLWCQTRKIKNIPEAVLKKMKPCTWWSVQGTLTKDEISLRGGACAIFSTKPVRVGFKGHVESVGDEEIEVHLSEPERSRCQRKKVKPEGNANLPNGLKPCDTITFEGYFINEETISARAFHIVAAGGEQDAGCHHIITPGNQIAAYSIAMPEIEIGNCGAGAIPGLQVECRIDSAGAEIYSDLRPVEALEAGEVAVVIFREWFSGGPGSQYVVSFETLLPDDENPLNNSVSADVMVMDEGLVPDQISVQTRTDIVRSGAIDAGPITMIIDTPAEPVAPMATLSGLVNGDRVSRQVTLSAVQAEGAGSLTAVEFLVDGISISQDEKAPYQCVWDASDELLGSEHQVMVRAFDDEGNATAQVTTVIIGGKGPTGYEDPVLISASVVPATGTRRTMFTFSVTYTDPLGAPPGRHEVAIDGQPAPMVPTSGDPVAGMTFILEMQLPPGEHSYQFMFEDAEENAVDSEIYWGPIVTDGGQDE